MQNIDKQIGLYNSSLNNALDYYMAPLVTKSIHFRQSKSWYSNNLQKSKR